MHIDDFVEQLCLGELSNLYLGLDGQTDLHPNNRKKLYNYVNQGLKALYSRFILKKSELIIVGRESMTLYPIRSEHSMSIGTSKVKFIDDTCCDPFQDDLIKILGVYNAIGQEFLLNEYGNPDSLFTPVYDTLQIPHPIQGQPYSVIYQAMPQMLRVEEDGCKIFYIPPILEEALVAFVGSKAYSHINGEANKATAAEFMSVFDARCAEADSGDLAGSSMVAQNDKPRDRGFL